MLRQIRAVEANRLVRIGSVIIVPIEQRRRRAGCELQCVHAEHTADIDLAGARQQFIAHHAHHRAWHHTQIFFDRSPALHRADGYICRCHPLIDHRPELGHFEQSGLGYIRGIDIFLDCCKLGLRRIIVVFHPLNAAKHFGKIQSLD